MEKLLGIEELSRLIGVEVSTLYVWTHRKAIPFIKVGRLVKFREGDINGWLNDKSLAPSHNRQSRQTRPDSVKGASTPPACARAGNAADRLIDKAVAGAKREILKKA